MRPNTDTLAVPHTEAGYERLVSLLDCGCAENRRFPQPVRQDVNAGFHKEQRIDELIDTIGENEEHSLVGLMETVGVLVENYEERHLPESAGDPLTTLRFLMLEHSLEVDELPEMGSEEQVRQVLAGTIALTLPQIRLLAQRFHVSPATFYL